MSDDEDADATIDFIAPSSSPTYTSFWKKLVGTGTDTSAHTQHPTIVSSFNDDTLDPGTLAEVDDKEAKEEEEEDEEEEVEEEEEEKEGLTPIQETADEIEEAEEEEAKDEDDEDASAVDDDVAKNEENILLHNATESTKQQETEGVVGSMAAAGQRTAYPSTRTDPASTLSNEDINQV
jgi:hypothetical protein